jgi:hypothetical protein
MNTKRKNTILILLSGFLVGAISFWFIPYEALKVWGISTLLLLALGSFLSALILRFYLIEETMRIVFIVTAGAIIPIIGRIIFDEITDLYEHNLFPIEIFMYLIIIVPSAFAGFYLSVLIKYLRKRYFF